MYLLKRLFGMAGEVDAKKALPLNVGEAAIKQNPFPAHREKILALQGMLIPVAATGDHEKFASAIKVFVSELNFYNSNVSRLIAVPAKSLFDQNSPHQDKVKVLFQQHNRNYRQLRTACTKLIESAPMLAGGDRSDDFTVLDDAQNDAISSDLNVIGGHLQFLEDVWQNLLPYENAVFKNSKVG